VCLDLLALKEVLLLLVPGEVDNGIAFLLVGFGNREEDGVAEPSPQEKYCPPFRDLGR